MHPYIQLVQKELFVQNLYNYALDRVLCSRPCTTNHERRCTKPLCLSGTMLAPNCHHVPWHRHITKFIHNPYPLNPLALHLFSMYVSHRHQPSSYYNARYLSYPCSDLKKKYRHVQIYDCISNWPSTRPHDGLVPIHSETSKGLVQRHGICMNTPALIHGIHRICVGSAWKAKKCSR